MGSLHAQEFAGLAGEGSITFEQAILWHLTSNHYPPVNPVLVEPCLKAIELANAGEADTEVELPKEVYYHSYSSAPARAIIEGFHLEAFLSIEED